MSGDKKERPLVVTVPRTGVVYYKVPGIDVYVDMDVIKEALFEYGRQKIREHAENMFGRPSRKRKRKRRS